jgi:ribosomal protein L11 methyltransferase
VPAWTSVRITAPSGLADAVANFLLERGAPGVLTDDDGADPAIVEAALPADSDVRAALDRWVASVAEIDARARDIRVTTSAAADVDWVAEARRHHPSVTVGRCLLVAPPWDVPAAAGREVLVVEPAMAFGTGHHATTRTCLVAIEEALAARPVGSALDVGTGSGILAMALARLGVPRVVALDVDAAVLPVARANLAQNGATGVAVLGGTLAAVRGRFDLVVANLLADAIVAEAARLDLAVAPGGRLVVSGVLAPQVGGVSAALAGWAVVATHAEDEWRTLVLERAGQEGDPR